LVHIVRGAVVGDLVFLCYNFTLSFTHSYFKLCRACKVKYPKFQNILEWSVIGLGICDMLGYVQMCMVHFFALKSPCLWWRCIINTKWQKVAILPSSGKQDRQSTYNITLWHFHVATVAVEMQQCSLCAAELHVTVSNITRGCCTKILLCQIYVPCDS